MTDAQGVEPDAVQGPGWTSRLGLPALLAGLVLIGAAAYLLPLWPGVSGATAGVGVAFTWLGKKATHHTLTQPLGLLLLVVGVVLLVVNQLVGPSAVLLQVAAAGVLAGAILVPRKSGF